MEAPKKQEAAGSFNTKTPLFPMPYACRRLLSGFGLDKLKDNFAGPRAPFSTLHEQFVVKEAFGCVMRWPSKIGFFIIFVVRNQVKGGMGRFDPWIIK
jgi:hypothetical protein